MKNLRKILALVLVVCMAFSFMAVASAKQITDYTDASTVKYTEAVDLMAGLGIMQGSDGTTFNPTGTFTREMAAKVTCYILLGATVSNSLTTSKSSFSDVAITRWSAPFIEYCTVNGIINGAGEGKFLPEAPITGTTMAKLILTALGFGAKGEYTGPNWEINTLVKAQSLGILNTGVNYSSAATRDQVAKYTFNALQTDPVTYNTVTGTYNNTVTDLVTPGKETLGYATFQLLKNNVANTNTGALSHNWKAYTTTSPVVVSASYSDDTVLFTNTMGYPFNITNVTSPSSGFYKVSLDTGVKYFVNGAPVTTQAAIDALGTTGSGATLDFGLTSKIGVIVKYVDNNDNWAANSTSNGLADSVYITQLSVSKLNAAPTADAAGNVTISASGLNGTYPKGTLTYPAGMAAKDYFTYVKWQGVTDQSTYIQKATKVTGQITSANDSGSNITFAGTSYYVASGAETAVLTNSANQNTAATAWVSSDGYVIFCKPDVTASYNIGLVVGYNYTGNAASGGTAQVRLYTNDGTVAVYNVAPGTSGNVPNQGATKDGVTGTSAFLPAGNGALAVAVSYTFDANKNVTVWPVTDLAKSGVKGDAGPVSSYSKQTSLITINGGGYYINTSTKVYYYDSSKPYSATGGAGVKNVAAVQTGFANTIDINNLTGTKNVTFVKDPNNDSLLNAIYFDMQAPVGAGGNYAYLTFASYQLRNVNSVNYYDYMVLVNGATTATKLTSVGTPIWQPMTKGLYSYTVDSNGYVTSATPAYPAVGTWKVTYVDSSFVGYIDAMGDNQTVAADANTKYFQVNPDTFAVTETTIPASIKGGATTYMTDYALSTASGAPALYIYYIVD